MARLRLRGAAWLARVSQRRADARQPARGPEVPAAGGADASDVMHPIVTDADLDLLLAAPLAVLYKHSPICPTSDAAYEEMLAFRRRRAVPVYIVDVIHHRPLSRALAE